MNFEKILSTPIDKANYCVFDVETTGLSPYKNKIIEIAIVKVSNLKIVDKYDTFINPGRQIPFFITNLTGINDDDVYDAPFFDEAADEIVNFIGDDILIAHNLAFDQSFLKTELKNCDREKINNPGVCTVKLARRLYPDLRSKSLSSVSSHLRLKNKDAHRAFGDAEVTAKVLIKMLKALKEKHELESVEELISFQHFPSQKTDKLKLSKKLSEDIVSLPDAPGNYYFLNAKNEIIYIGKAKSLKNRVKSYFSSNATRKAKKIVKQASRLKIEITNTELTALLSEAESIKIKNPKHNTQLKEYGNKYFLRIKNTEEFPSIEVCNYFDFDGNDYFGLFTTKKKALKVFEMINKAFAIRECDEKEFNKHKGCFLADIERCTAPCLNQDKQKYNDELLKIYEFLFGKNQFALTRLINKMKFYSDQERYEKAAEAKELIDLVLAQTHKSSLLAEPVNSANVLFEVNGGFQCDYLLMIEGRIFIKNNPLKKKDQFEEAIDDYYEKVNQLDIMPTEEDLEKMKITLNWLIKNRTKVRMFYLKNYQNKRELYSKLTQNRYWNESNFESEFDIKNFIDTDVLKEY